MSLWSQLRSGLRGLLRSHVVDREVADEIQSFLEQATLALEEAGMSHEQARIAALASFGDRTSQRERIRSLGWERHLRNVGEDLRLAWGQLRAGPLFALRSTVGTAIGIAACVSIFMVWTPLFFSMPTYPHADRIVSIWEKGPHGGLIADTYGTFRDVSIHPRGFSALAAIKYETAVTDDFGSRVVIGGARVTPGYFAVYGVEPVMGRVFLPSDEYPQAPPVAVVSYAAWSRVYKRDASLSGRSINLDGIRYTIIGVAPPSFADAMHPSSEFWIPLRYDNALPADGREWGHHIHIIGKLNPHARPAEVERDFSPQFANWVTQHRDGYNNSGGLPAGIAIDSPQSFVRQREKTTISASIAGVILFFALVCTTVIGLMLVYGIQRRMGQPIRVARGATGPRILRQLILEGLLITAPASVLGIYAATLAAGALNSILAHGTIAFHRVPLSLSAVFFAGLLAVLLALVFGTVPFIVVRRSRFWHDKGASNRNAQTPVTKLLLSFEFAVSFTLLGAATLLLWSSHLLSKVSPGFQPERVVALQLRLATHMSDIKENSDPVLSKELSAVRRLSGVEAVGFVNQLPLSGEHEVYGIQVANAPRQAEPDSALHYSVTPGYLETMHIHLIQGRLLGESDAQPQALKVVIVSKALAKRRFGDENPIGKPIRVGLNAGRQDAPWATIVGVVDDVRQDSLSTPGESAFYLPANQWMLPERTFWLVMRTRRGSPFNASEIISTLRNIDSTVAISRMTTMDQLIVASAKERRLVLVLYEAFGAMALLFVATGITALRGVNSRKRRSFPDTRMTQSPTYLPFRQVMEIALVGLLCGSVLYAVAIHLLLRPLLQTPLAFPRIHTGIGVGLGASVLLIFVLRQAYFIRRQS